MDKQRNKSRMMGVSKMVKCMATLSKGAAQRAGRPRDAPPPAREQPPDTWKGLNVLDEIFSVKHEPASRGRHFIKAALIRRLIESIIQNPQ
jgi:hypothetical protein